MRIGACLHGTLCKSGGAGDRVEERGRVPSPAPLSGTLELPEQRRRDDAEGERQMRRSHQSELLVGEALVAVSDACVEAEPAEFLAELLIESSVVPESVGGGVERKIWVIEQAEVDQLFELRRVRQEKLLVATLLLQPPQLRAAGVRLAERDETEDGDEGEQRGDDEGAEELLRPDRQWNACDRSYERIADGVENPAHSRCPRIWSGNSRTRIGFSR